LVVDDDKPFVSALAQALRRRGYEVFVAHDVDEGLAEARAWRPSRVIVDLRMPGRSGLDLVAALASELPETKTVVLTGFGSISTAVEAIKRGAVQYLTKPVSVGELLSALDGQGQSGGVPEATPLDVVEWEHLQRVLNECEGNVSEAARRLGLHRRTLQRKLARGRGSQ
jgi:two-component system response regulator RegA